MNLNIRNIPSIFNVKRKNNKVYLKVGNAQKIGINLPFEFDKNLAKISAMLLDGTLDKNLSRFMFSQKKDFRKIEEFFRIIKYKFNITPKLHKLKHGAWTVTISSKTLSSFLYYCLDINKCDENTKIPKWIYQSSKEIKIIYLRYAFDMEGSITDPRIGSRGIRFHSCDKYHTEELRRFILADFNINFKTFKYFIKDYGWKYYLEIRSIEEIRKFKEIGFSLQSHKKRLKQVLENIKPNAWEITLKKLLELKNRYFRIKDVNRLFPHLCKRAIHQRLVNLIKMGYLSSNNEGYFLVSKEIEKAKKLLNVKNVKLRTNPRENEKLIFELIKRNGVIWRNEISRTLNIHTITVHDVLNRLLDDNKIELSHIDNFHRKNYKIYSGSSPRF